MDRIECIIPPGSAGTWEEAVRGFLLKNSTRIRLAQSQWMDFGLFRIRRFHWDMDPDFIFTLRRFKKFFLKKVSALSDPRDRDSRAIHFYYKLSSQIQEWINEEGLFLGHPSAQLFYGFENPAFYRNNSLLGRVMTYERTIALYPTQSEKQELESAGLELGRGKIIQLQLP
ncbi:MAG: hypothetical protein WC488_03515 [Candidatus Micrarchaeia archaeon]